MIAFTLNLTLSFCFFAFFSQEEEDDNTNTDQNDENDNDDNQDDDDDDDVSRAMMSCHLPNFDTSTDDDTLYLFAGRK